MLYVELTGGLGNQIFQYACGRYLQKTIGDKVKYVSESYKSDELRELSLNKFCICKDWENIEEYNFWQKHKLAKFVFSLLNHTEKILGLNKRGKITPYYKFKLFLFTLFGIYTHDYHKYIMPETHKFPNDKFVRGMWHHPMYFNDFRDELIKEISLKEDYVLHGQLEDDILNSNSVCVHIRRGDYTKYSNYIVCDIDYYERAIKALCEKAKGLKFFIFSDDIEWVKQNLNFDGDIVFVEPHKDYEDFDLMCKCRHFVISNSTYSWWAAYLGQSTEKLVITPDRWYNDGQNKEWLNLENWIVMKTEKS